MLAARRVNAYSKFPPYLYPMLYAKDEGAKHLSYFLTSGFPAVSVKECDGYTSVYSATRYLSSEVVRAIARVAGVHLYLENDDVVYACDRFLTVHSSRTEMHRMSSASASWVSTARWR